MSTVVDRQSSRAVVATLSDTGPDAVNEISGALTTLLADVFTLYLKTKNFHWHMSGQHFRDYPPSFRVEVAGLLDQFETLFGGSGSRTAMPARCRPMAC